MLNLYGMGHVGRNLSKFEIRMLASYCLEQSPSGYTISERGLIDPAHERDIGLMVQPKKPVLKMTRREHADSFFRDGTLRLGTYNDFRTAGHPEIRDHQEGFVVLIGESLGRTAWGTFEADGDSFVFCTFLGDPDPSVVADVGYDSYYFIHDVSGFATAVMTTLDSLDMAFGKCVYCSEKAMLGAIQPDYSFDRIDHKSVEMIGSAMHFLKPVKYSHQSEFRFVWQMGKLTREPLIIQCPEAVQYCSRPD